MQAISRMDGDEQSVSGQKVERKLSRKRRYLIFPTGSSIQLGMVWNANSLVDFLIEIG